MIIKKKTKKNTLIIINANELHFVKQPSSISRRTIRHAYISDNAHFAEDYPTYKRNKYSLDFSALFLFFPV